MSAAAVFFYLFAALAVAGALGMVLNVRNTVAGAMSLVLTMVALGGIYVLLDAYLVGVLQILVYAGAIVVLFLFVVMLLNLRGEQLRPGALRAREGVGVVVAGVAAARSSSGWCRSLGPPAVLRPRASAATAHVGLDALHGLACCAFEVASLLLLAAIVGAVVLAKRKVD